MWKCDSYSAFLSSEEVLKKAKFGGSSAVVMDITGSSSEEEEEEDRDRDGDVAMKDVKKKKKTVLLDVDYPP